MQFFRISEAWFEEKNPLVIVNSFRCHCVYQDLCQKEFLKTLFHLYCFSWTVPQPKPLWHLCKTRLILCIFGSSSNIFWRLIFTWCNIGLRFCKLITLKFRNASRSIVKWKQRQSMFWEENKTAWCKLNEWSPVTWKEWTDREKKGQKIKFSLRENSFFGIINLLLGHYWG